MKVFDSESIRNVAVVGHGDTGKTSLVSAILFSSGAVNRLGRIEDGTTTTDYDEDEIERQITINTALAHCEWKGNKINLLDTPGYRAFILDAKSAMTAAETALILVDAVGGVEVQTERVWDFASSYQIARLIVVNKLDRDNGNFKRTLASLQKSFGRKVVPIQLPIGSEQDFRGIVDLVTGKAFVYSLDGKGNVKVESIPEDMQAEVERRREELIEMVAENDDQLMEKFFEEGTLTDQELASGLARAISQQSIYPVMCVSATRNIAVAQLLDAIADLCPDAVTRKPVPALDAKSKEEKEVAIAKDGPSAAYVFKTLADPFAGRINLFKVYSGSLKSDTSLRNLESGGNKGWELFRYSRGNLTNQ